MSYSSGSGGTLTLPSPTHVHHVDVNPAVTAVRSLRRSVSRSPSRFGLARSASSTSSSAEGSPSSTSHTPQSPTPTSPRFPTQAQNSPLNFSTPVLPYPSASSSTPQTTAFTPFRTGVKLSVRSARPRPLTARPLTRTRASPKSPLKRVFGASSDSINLPNPAPAAPEVQAQPEPLNSTIKFQDFAQGLSSLARHNLEKPSSRHSVHLDVSGASKHSLSKLLDIKNDSLATTTASPLKRSDALMNLDQPSLGSPVAKRRSLHGISSFGNDFNIFDHPPAPTSQPNFEIHEDAMNLEYQLSGSGPALDRDQVPPPTPTVPRRSSSLRRTTLQQRHGEGRTSWGRRQGEKSLAQIATEATTPAAPRNRPRLSLDQYLPPDPRGSPFSHQGPLPNPSTHHLFGGHPAHSRHPLSRTITQSSSGSSSSVPDDSPTHFPLVHQISDRARVPLNFAKSVPIGSYRPTEGHVVSTPAYKNAKPDPTAFNSTGLVSKVGKRAAEIERAKLEATSTPMPDTPCKKQHYPANTFPPQSLSGRRQTRPSFAGSPSTPFQQSWMNPPAFPIKFGNSEDLGGLFYKQTAKSHSRRSSLLSLEGEDIHGAGDADFIPPTPTKNLFSNTPSVANQATTTPNGSPNASRFLPAATPSAGNSADVDAQNQSCKSSRSYTVADNAVAESQLPRSRTPVTLGQNLSPLVSKSSASYCPPLENREQLCTPIPLKLVLKMSAAVSQNDHAKTYSRPASLLERLGNLGTSTPKTPHGMAPPDASRLSMSNSHKSGPSSARPPATPTTQGRMSFIGRGDRRFSITPVHDDFDVDYDVLRRRFNKVEPIGSGEFSHVFKVTQTTYRSPFVPPFATTPSRHTPASARQTAQVYVVKKISAPITGPKERKKRYHEANVLKALSHCDHVVQYFDSWEENFQLYIQTEFCEEGTLEDFLDNVGKTGRLDDFRLWKILLELCYGTRDIHNNGFMHLDLKPANVFITSQGILKIGDFGLAAEWPIRTSIDGEGDRVYIAPEILRGQYDKPADIFSLGLMMLEAAGNVCLPDNGSVWVEIRDGDLTHVPSLTCVAAGSVVRDASGTPICQDSAISPPAAECIPFEFSGSTTTHNASNLFGAARRSELRSPPDFMANATDPNSLDSIVTWMLHPDPRHRPDAEQLLRTGALCWIYLRRHAGATVYEGNWGPEEGPWRNYITQGSVDTEMTDA